MLEQNQTSKFLQQNVRAVHSTGASSHQSLSKALVDYDNEVLDRTRNGNTTLQRTLMSLQEIFKPYMQSCEPSQLPSQSHNQSHMQTATMAHNSGETTTSRAEADETAFNAPAVKIRLPKPKIEVFLTRCKTAKRRKAQTGSARESSRLVLTRKRD